jgi:hypothetical protein
MIQIKHVIMTPALAMESESGLIRCAARNESGHIGLRGGRWAA